MVQSEYYFKLQKYKYVLTFFLSAGTVLNTLSTTTPPPTEWTAGTPVGLNEGTCVRS